MDLVFVVAEVIEISAKVNRPKSFQKICLCQARVNFLSMIVDPDANTVAGWPSNAPLLQHTDMKR